MSESQLAEELEKRLRLAAGAIANIGQDLAASEDARRLVADLRQVQEDIDNARMLSEVLEQHILNLERFPRPRQPEITPRGTFRFLTIGEFMLLSREEKVAYLEKATEALKYMQQSATSSLFRSPPPRKK